MEDKIKKIRLDKNAEESWGAIAPIYAVPLDGEPAFLGTGFFITPSGLLVTAKHVAIHVVDKAGGEDLGSISAIQWHKTGPISRPITTAYWHPIADVALCDTGQVLTPEGEPVSPLVLTLTLEIPLPGAAIATHAFHGADESLVGEKRPPLHNAEFIYSGQFRWLKGGLAQWDSEIRREIKYRSRVTVGRLRKSFPEGRDSVMLPFPCYESDTPIYGGTSGGPVFDEKGRVFALNCTSLVGSDVSYHTSIAPLFDLSVPNAVLPGETAARSITIRELAALDYVAVDPLVACKLHTVIGVKP